MKKLLTICFIFLICVMSSCMTIKPDANFVKQTQDTIKNPTTTLLSKDVIAELPKSTSVKTDQNLTVVLTEDTKVNTTTEELLIPKHTQLILPPNTNLQTTNSSKISLDSQTEVILPVGTEISISKINWYAILFYLTIIVVAAWYYIRGTNEDKNNDGYVDTPKQKKKTKS